MYSQFMMHGQKNIKISSYVTNWPWMWPYTGCDGRTFNSRMWDYF